MAKTGSFGAGRRFFALTARAAKTACVLVSLRSGVALCLCSVLLFACSASVSARQKPPLTKTISGSVLEPSRQGVSGASVLVTDLRTHITDATYSGANGAYSFPGLNPSHDYQVKAMYKGRSSAVREVSAFDTRMRIVINLVLKPSSRKSPSNSASASR